MTDEIDLRRLLATLRRQAVLIAAIAVIVMLATTTISLLQETTYTASTTLLYEPSAITTTLQGGSTQDQARMISTLAQLPGTATILVPAAKELGAVESDLEHSISVSADSTANLITITATAPTAVRAQLKADVVAKQFVAWRSKGQRQLLVAQVQALADELSTIPRSQAAEIEAQLAQARAALSNTTADLSVIQPAKRPTSPSSPKTIRNAVIGLMAGLLLGVIIALARDRIDRRLTTIEDAEAAYGLPLLGVVPFLPDAAKGRRELGLADFAGTSPLADAYRAIRTALVLYRLDRGTPRVVAVTSAVPSEGKSAAVANLAAALAASGRKVLAVSADLRAPGLQAYFPETAAGSILDVLLGHKKLADAVSNVPLAEDGGGQLDLLADASMLSDPAALFGSERFAKVLEEASAVYDVLVLDAPPVIAAGETVVLAQRADAVVLVAGIDRATRDSAARSRAFLTAAGVEPLGLIVTGWRNAAAAGYGYGYGYGQSYGNAPGTRRAAPA